MLHLCKLYKFYDEDQKHVRGFKGRVRVTWYEKLQSYMQPFFKSHKLSLISLAIGMGYIGRWPCTHFASIPIHSLLPHMERKDVFFWIIF